MRAEKAIRKQVAAKKIEKDIEVINKLGLHARPSSMLVKLTTQFQSDIYIRKDSDEVNGKSIMGIITLAAGKGTILRFIISGVDAQEAMDRIEQLFLSKFGEDKE
jgi:phosphocarrier protein